jgi:catechol 2,3-dioxygenase
MTEPRSGAHRAPQGPPDPEEMEARGATPPGSLPAATRMGPVHLTVGDLGRSSAYYREAIGLTALDQKGPWLSLGAGGSELLRLFEAKGARPEPGTTGLYHFALLVPRRADLARWLAHAAKDRVPLDGMSDHFVSEALYLSDPDDHGIEIYWDRPRELWEGKVGSRLTTIPLDVDDLMTEGGGSTEPFAGLPPGTTMGHVHLRVADIPSTLDFYRDTLGFGLMAQLGLHAAFLAAGGYHHHLGANTWGSAGGRPAPQGAAALRHATIVLPSAAERDALTSRLSARGVALEEGAEGPRILDPSGNALVLAVEERPPA